MSESMTPVEAAKFISYSVHNKYLLLDSGQMPGLVRTVYAKCDTPEFLPLLPLEKYGQSAFDGPQIVKVNSDCLLLTTFEERENQGVLILSPLELEEITAYLRKLFFQKIEGRLFFFRFYDWRIFNHLALYEQASIVNFFGNAISSMLWCNKVGAGEVEFILYSHPGELAYAAAPFTLSVSMAQAMGSGHAERLDELLAQYLTAENELFSKFTLEEKKNFIAAAKRQAFFFGITGNDELKIFMREWLLTGPEIERQPTHMRNLQDSGITVPEKLSYMYSYRIIYHNPYTCCLNPVALMARRDFYRALPHWVETDGVRKAMALTGDHLARMRYNTLYLGHERNASGLCQAVGVLLGSATFARLRQPYNFYQPQFAKLEAALAAELEQVACYE